MPLLLFLTGGSSAKTICGDKPKNKANNTAKDFL
jgi:hypothetical protein